MAGLADSINNTTPAAIAAPPRGTRAQAAPSRAPKLVPASMKRKGEAERIHKVAVIGPAGVGKTHSVFSLIKHLGTVCHLNPEEIRIEMIDLDGGTDEITDQRIIPDEYLERLFISTCPDFPSVVDATKEAYVRLNDHKKQHGIDGTWIIVDNMDKAWNYVQNDYCLAVYGMPLVEKMEQAREATIRNKKLGQKGEGVFDKNLDWGIIKPMHADWTKSFETCGFNFLWLSPWKMQEIKDSAGNVVETHEKFGSDENSLKVSYIIKLYQNDSKKRCADFIKSRATNTLPKNIPYTTWSDLFKELDKISAYELKERDAKMKSELYGKPASKSVEPVSKTSPEDVKEQRTEEIMSVALNHSIEAAEKAKIQAAEDLDW